MLNKDEDINEKKRLKSNYMRSELIYDNKPLVRSCKFKLSTHSEPIKCKLSLSDHKEYL